MELPNFLPQPLKLGGTFEEILDSLYSVFENDFKVKRTCHCNLRVIYDNRILPDGRGKEEGFWHVISMENQQTGDREIDFRRAERLPWACPMMGNETRPELRVYDYDHVSKDEGIRRYIWLYEYDYVIVLRKKKNIYFWVTAFYVDSRGRKHKLSKQYTNRL